MINIDNSYKSKNKLDHLYEFEQGKFISRGLYSLDFMDMCLNWKN